MYINCSQSLVIFLTWKHIIPNQSFLIWRTETWALSFFHDTVNKKVGMFTLLWEWGSALRKYSFVSSTVKEGSWNCNFYNCILNIYNLSGYWHVLFIYLSFQPYEVCIVCFLCMENLRFREITKLSYHYAVSMW